MQVYRRVAPDCVAPPPVTEAFPPGSRAGGDQARRSLTPAEAASVVER
ncbi:hypothetical protein BH24ACT3_BH24ACT3_06850 [soil metagenome]